MLELRARTWSAQMPLGGLARVGISGGAMPWDSELVAWQASLIAP